MVLSKRFYFMIYSFVYIIYTTNTVRFDISDMV